MPILIEEWSPFLTITSLIESLDCLMEEPETKYPASPEMLDIYETNKDEYFKKVLNSFENSEIDIQEDLDISNRMAESF